MSRMERGDKLPCDTVVYFKNMLESGIYNWRSVLAERKHLRPVYFIYSEVDGLWASYAVRHLWEHVPSRHHHASLFTLLYENLKI